jgi:hypothetical protein
MHEIYDTETHSDQPQTFNGDLAALPAALRPLTKHKRWIVWRWVQKKPGAKWTKPPYRADDPSAHALSNEPSTWSSYATAVAAVKAGKADGIGYVLTNANGTGTGAIDLDKCRDPGTGQLAPWAQELIGETNSYVEATVSGTGLRIVGTVEGANIDKSVAAPDGGEVEFYRRGARYITISGMQIGNCDALQNIDELVDRAYEKFAGEAPPRYRARAARTRRRRENPISPSLLKLCEGHAGMGISTDPDDLVDFDLYVRAINLIPNPDLPWKEWKKIIMAIWATFLPTIVHGAGSTVELRNEDGLAAAHAWSRKSCKYDADGTDQAWDEVSASPPSNLSAGTLLYMADQASPGWRANVGEPSAAQQLVEPSAKADESKSPEPTVPPSPEVKADKSTTDAETPEQPTTQADKTDSGVEDDSTDAKAERPSTTSLCWIETSLTFTSSFTPPDYLIDEVLQRRFLYSMTAPTGGGKTSVSLSMAAHLDLGRPLGGHELEKCKVLFLAGENPDDVCMRWIKQCEELEIDHAQVGVHFLPHVMSLTDRNALSRIRSESLAAGPFGAVFVDTSAAYNEAEEENDNVQMGKHARALRNLNQVIDGGPTIIATTHPTKNANMDNLLPRGGGAFLAEVDGNLVCQKVPDSMAVDLHWHGKFRGPDFSPIPFELRAGTTDKLKTSKGKLIWTVTAMPITPEQRTVLDDRAARDQDEVLAYMLENPSASFGEIATGVGWIQRDGLPYKMKVQRVIKGMVPTKLVEKAGRSDRWALTKKGKMEAEDAKARIAVM